MVFWYNCNLRTQSFTLKERKEERKMERKTFGETEREKFGFAFLFKVVCTSLNILLPPKADLRCPLCQNMNVIFRTLFKLSWKTIYLYQGQNVNNEVEKVTLLRLRNRKLDYLEKMCFYAHYVCLELNPKFSIQCDGLLQFHVLSILNLLYWC